MRRERGITYLWTLFIVVLIGIGLAGAGTAWQTWTLREKEKQLLFVGDEIRRAIGSYRDNSPGVQRFPMALEELLLDRRFPVVRRHLRKLYLDPITNKPEWGLVKAPDGGIIGVFSLSEAKPLKQDEFPKPYETFRGKEKYTEWVFAHTVAGTLPGQVPTGKPATSPFAGATTGQPSQSPASTGIQTSPTAGK